MINELNTMTTQTDNIAAGLGALFKSAREALNLTQKEVAARLRLGVNIIYLIENENYTAGPPATFMRGYIRSYAKLVNIAENELTSTLKQLDPEASSNNVIPVTVLNTQTVKRHDRHIRWMTYAIVFTLIALVCIWWASHSRYNAADVPEKASAVVALNDTESKISTVNLPVPQVADKEVVASTQQIEQTIKVPDATTPSAEPLSSPPPAISAQAAVTPAIPAAMAPPVAAAVAPPTPVTEANAAPQPVAKSLSRARHHRSQGISKMVMALPEPGLDNEESPSES